MSCAVAIFNQFVQPLHKLTGLMPGLLGPNSIWYYFTKTDDVADDFKQNFN